MEYTGIETKNENGIFTITFNRPERLNALDRATLEELNHALETIENTDGIRVVIVKGSGKAFIAGADISAMVNMTGKEAEEFSKFGQDVFLRLENLDVPVIASVNGFCLGGGCELAMSCDIRISSSRAKYGQPEVNLGVIPGFGGTQRLPNLVGIGNAIDLLTTGRIIKADIAVQMGLIERIVEPENLDEEVNKIAVLITSKCPSAVISNKKIGRAGLPKFQYGLEAKEFGDCFKRGDAKIGMQAFLDKKEPEWR